MEKKKENVMTIRKYHKKDCDEVFELFYNTVHNINIKNYTNEQIEAWANLSINQEDWCKSLEINYSLVYTDDIEKTKEAEQIETNEEKNEEISIIGFGDITRAGYLNRLYIHKDHIGKGIGNLLAKELEEYATSLGLKEIVTHASITARPFFEKRGYQLIKEQEVERDGQYLTNYIMKKGINKKT